MEEQHGPETYTFDTKTRLATAYCTCGASFTGAGTTLNGATKETSARVKLARHLIQHGYEWNNATARWEKTND